MKLGGGLNFVTGPMGAGKTLYGVRRIVRAVSTGKFVVTNIELRPGWAMRTARHFSPAGSEAKRRKMANNFERLYVYETELADVMKYRLNGDGEARGFFVWDESHNDLDNRKWKDEGRDVLIEWATQLRKLGFLGFLLSQHADNVDAKFRRVCNYHVRLQNQREQTRMFGLRISPWPLFLAYWYPANLALKGQVIPPTTVERYFLSWHRHLYDTHGLFHGLSEHETEVVQTVVLGADTRTAGSQRGSAAAPRRHPGGATNSRLSRDNATAEGS